MGRHPRAAPATARFWAELILSTVLFGGVFGMGVKALGATAWDWHVSPWLVAYYAFLIMCGWAMQWVIAVAVARTFVGWVVDMWQWLGDLVWRFRHRNDPVIGMVIDPDEPPPDPATWQARFFAVCIDCDGLAGPGFQGTPRGCICPAGPTTTRAELDLDPAARP